MSESIEVRSEREDGASWIFELSLGGTDLVTSTMRLAWADYDWWAPDGRNSPSEVALAVARTFADSLALLGESHLPATFDASVVRRRVGGADRLIASRLGLPR